MSAQFLEAVKQSIEQFDEMDRRAIEAGWPRNSVTIRTEDSGNRRILSVNGVDIMEGGFRMHRDNIEILSNVLNPIPRPTPM